MGPDLHWAGRGSPIFRITALTGAFAAVALAVCEADQLGAAPRVKLALCLGAMVTFLALAFATQAIVGREVLIYYRHEIASDIPAAVPRAHWWWRAPFDGRPDA